MSTEHLTDADLDAIERAARGGCIHYHPGYHVQIPAIVAELRAARGRLAKLERVAEAARKADAFIGRTSRWEMLRGTVYEDVRAALADLDGGKS